MNNNWVDYFNYLPHIMEKLKNQKERKEFSQNREKNEK